jgi:hypothetical protein
MEVDGVSGCERTFSDFVLLTVVVGAQADGPFV